MFEFKLFDFYVYNKYIKGDPDQDNNVFTIQMFGINELGETASITVNNFKPFLYILVDVFFICYILYLISIYGQPNTIFDVP